jgi:hypothetical protein
MELLGFEVEAQAVTAEDTATEAGRWFAATFGVIPRLAAYVADRDAERLVGPAGLTVDLIRPPSAEENESHISEFIDSAADLDGPPTDELADAVVAIVKAAYDAIDERLAGVAHNKVLAAFLLVGQRSRATPPDEPEYWQRSAASTLLSSFVGRGASS